MSWLDLFLQPQPLEKGHFLELTEKLSRDCAQRPQGRRGEAPKQTNTNLEVIIDLKNDNETDDDDNDDDKGSDWLG